MNKNSNFEKNWLNLEKLPSSFRVLSNIISQRKAIREYNSQKIPSELVEKVIKIACRAPSCLNLATSPMGGFKEKEIIDYLEQNNLVPAGKYNLAVSFAVGYPSK
ncbi:1348_t:CDS:2, partial [Entrophospora sp. SA101]